MSSTTPSRRWFPSSGLVAGVAFVGGVGAALATADAPYPRPGAGPDAIRSYFLGNPTAARISVAGQLLSSAALVPFTATVARLALASGRRGSAVAISGGALAAISQAYSAVCSAALTRAHSDDTTRALHQHAFLSGGPVHTAGLGLLTAALATCSPQALPPPLLAAARVVAPLGMATPLTLAAPPPAMAAIPLARVAALAIAGATGVVLRRRAAGT
jgi:hypothetical protein